MFTTIFQKKREPYRNPKILKGAKRENCTINSPECNYNPDTVVAAHSNWSEDGKGAGQKADDIYVAYACSGCHKWLDEGPDPKEVKKAYFHRGMKKTWRILIDKQILK